MGALIGGQSPDSTQHQSPSTGSIVPVFCTSLAPTATFTLTPACASEIAGSAPDTANNVHPGPSTCDHNCDLLRQLSGTCCRSGGSLSNPVRYSSRRPVAALASSAPRLRSLHTHRPIKLLEQSYATNQTFNISLILPAGFILPASTLLPGATYPAGVPLAGGVTLPAGFVPIGPLTVRSTTTLQELPSQVP